METNEEHLAEAVADRWFRDTADVVVEICNQLLTLPDDRLREGLIRVRNLAASKGTS